jgi:hypothetical protein
VHRRLILEDSETASLLDKMTNYKPETTEKWLDRDDL